MLFEIQDKEIYLTELFNDCTVSFQSTVDEILRSASANEDYLFVVEEKIPAGLEDISCKLFNTTHNIIPGGGSRPVFDYTFFYENAPLRYLGTSECYERSKENEIAIDSFNKVIRFKSKGAYVKLEPFNLETSGLFVLHKENGTPIVVDLMIDGNDNYHYNCYHDDAVALALEGKHSSKKCATGIKFIKQPYHYYMPYFWVTAELLERGFLFKYHSDCYSAGYSEYDVVDHDGAPKELGSLQLPPFCEKIGATKISVDNKRAFEAIRSGEVYSSYWFTDANDFTYECFKVQHYASATEPADGRCERKPTTGKYWA